MASTNPSGIKILVTGGAGYIGSTLVPILLREGYSVVIYDLFRWGISPLLNSYLDTRNLDIVNGDILDDLTVQPVVQSCDLVIHLAGIVSAPAFDRYPEIAQEVNERGTKILIESLRPNQQLLFTSVENVYGKIGNRTAPCTEDMECNPQTTFAETFSKSEKLVLESGGVVLRLPSAFGISPRMRLDLLVNNLVHQACLHKHIALYQGGFKRNFIHIQDVANALLFSVNNLQKMRGNIYNVGSSSLVFTKREVCKMIQSHLPDVTISEPEDEGYMDSDSRDFEISFEKIEKLGYKTRKTIEDGISELLRVVPFMSAEEVEKCQAL